ncbi:hypothetical protein C3L33_17890, partial [Rhododendron williamsianum]
MLQNKSFSRKTRQGKVIKVVREHYLRDDIYCGAPFCKVCDSSAARLSSTASTVLIVDTNVVLNQIDLLENEAIDDVVVLSVVLDEVKNKNLGVYNRLRALCSNSVKKFLFSLMNTTSRDTYVKAMVGKSPNDRNDRGYTFAFLQCFVSLIFEAYVKSLGQPGLLDLLVQVPSEDVGMEDVEDLRTSKKKIIYTEVSLFASAFF